MENELLNPETIQLAKTLSADMLRYTLDLVGALALLVVGWYAASWVRRNLRRALTALPQFDRTVAVALSNLARYVILILVLVAVLAQFGVQTASILAVMGTIGLAIGLALQGTLSNIAAGFMLLFLRPFKVGDYIDAEGIEGTVDEVGLFATQLTTYDGIFLAVPNNQIWSRSILNYSRLPTRRMDIVVSIAYEDDTAKAMTALEDLVRHDERVMTDPKPKVMVKELADSSVNLNVRFWTSTAHYWDLMWHMNKATREAVEAVGCTIPYPQRDLHIVTPEALKAV